MDNNEDWKELEKWSKDDEERKIDRYGGIDLSKVNIEKERKKVDIVSKILDKMTIILRVLRILGIVLLIIVLFIFMINTYSGIK